MADDFFGQYLVSKKVITGEQLQQAVMIQTQDRLLLGEIALKEGLLSNEQLQEILQEQRMSGQKFGQIARAKGYLDQQQFQNVLELQASNHVLLGEALVRLGVVGKGDLLLYLKDFAEQVQARETIFERELAGHPLSQVIQLCLRITQEYLNRMGYITKRSMLDFQLPEPGVFSFFLEQTTPSGTNYLGLHLTALGAQTLLGEQGRDMGVARQHEEISQLLFNLNYIICQDLRKLGLGFKHGAIQCHAPVTRQHISMRLASFIDNLDISYSFN